MLSTTPLIVPVWARAEIVSRVKKNSNRYFIYHSNEEFLNLLTFYQLKHHALDIITCLPKLIESPFSDSILKRAQKKGLVTVNIIDLRSYSTDKHKSIDDYAYGGGAGMVMMIEPIDRCLNDLKSKRQYDDIIYMSPDGERLTQSLANALSLKKQFDFTLWPL